MKLLSALIVLSASMAAHAATPWQVRWVQGQKETVWQASATEILKGDGAVPSQSLNIARSSLESLRDAVSQLSVRENPATGPCADFVELNSPLATNKFCLNQADSDLIALLARLRQIQ